MAVVYTDDEIAALIAEPKPIVVDEWRVTFKRNHREESMDVQGDAGNEFRIIRRINEFDEFDFSIILGVILPRTRQVFRLLRYDGNRHQHTNHIEGSRLYDFHIHIATERYQESDFPDDGYAEATGRYSDIDGAFDCIFADAGFYKV